MNANIPPSLRAHTFQAFHNYWTARDPLKLHLSQLMKLITLPVEPIGVPKMETPSYSSHYSHHNHSPKQGIILKIREPWSSKSWSHFVFFPQSPSLSYSRWALGFLPSPLHLDSTAKAPGACSPWSTGFQQPSPLSLIHPTQSRQSNLGISALLHCPPMTPTKRFVIVFTRRADKKKR